MQNQTTSPAQSTTSSAPQHGRSSKGCLIGCLVAGGIGCILFLLLIGFLVIIGMNMEKAKSEKLEGIMEAIAQGNYAKAHEFISPSTTVQKTVDDMEKFVEKNELKGHTDCKWVMGEEDAQGNYIYHVSMTREDGSEATIYAPMVEEDGQWKILALLTELPEKPTADTADGDGGKVKWGINFTTATISNIRMSDQKDASASKVTEFPSDTKVIYCLADIKYAPSGTTVESKWYFLGSDDNPILQELGSKSLATTESTMNFHFTLTRDRSSFLVGNYRVKIFVEEKEQGSVDFAIRELTIEEIEKKAEAGDVTSQYNLAVAYRDGTGVKSDMAKAVYWTRKAAEQGDEMAQHNLGLHYLKGVGVVQDNTQAASWFQKAADQGFPRAMYSLGELYEKGDGVAQNHEKAVSLYKKAADKGNKPAQAAIQRLGQKS